MSITDFFVFLSPNINVPSRTYCETLVSEAVQQRVPQPLPYNVGRQGGVVWIDKNWKQITNSITILNPQKYTKIGEKQCSYRQAVIQISQAQQQDTRYKNKHPHHLHKVVLRNQGKICEIRVKCFCSFSATLWKLRLSERKAELALAFQSVKGYG